MDLPPLLSPIVLTLALALTVTAILVIVATPLSWWLARGRGGGRDVVGAVVTLPLVLPPTVLGFYLLLALGPSGPGGAIAGLWGARTLAFSFAGLVIGGEAVHADVQAWLEGVPAHPVDLVVLDPPRSGAKRRVVESIAARTPSRVVYVACDPAALARDVATFADHGYRLGSLRAYDLFPMTHHVECVALLNRR